MDSNGFSGFTFATLAQSVKRLVEAQKISGAIPEGGTIYKGILMSKCLYCNDTKKVMVYPDGIQVPYLLSVASDSHHKRVVITVCPECDKLNNIWRAGRAA